MTSDATSPEETGLPGAPPRPAAALPPNRPRRRRAWRWLAGILLVLVLLIGGAIGTAWWALRSETGSAWLLSKVPGLTLTQPHGSLVGDFAASRAELRIPGVGQLRIEGLVWRGLEVGRAPAGLWLRIAIAELRASQVEWQPQAKASNAPSAPPTSLALPLEIDVAALHIGEARIGAPDATPLRDIEAKVHLGADLGSVHRVDKLALTWGRIRANGSVQIATTAPLQLEARIEAAQDAAASGPAASGPAATGPTATGPTASGPTARGPTASRPAASGPTASGSAAVGPAASGPARGGPAWNASASAVGPLVSPLVQATVRAPAQTGHPAQSLDARATVRPYAPWPLGNLDLTAKSLDLSAFHAALPVTALSGEATAQTRGMNQPSVVTARLVNGGAGRWNDGRLPLRKVELEVRARPDNLRVLDLRALDAELGSAAKPAGRIEGHGQWTPARWNLDAVFTDVQPALLDARAPAMTLSGPLAFSATGVDPAAARSGPIDIKGTLKGQLAERGPLRSVQLKLDAGVGPGQIELREAELRAGDAMASLAGAATHAATGDSWQLNGRATLVDFDPATWAPGAADSPWRHGPNRLNAKSNFDVAVPSSIAGLPWREALAAVRGEAALTFDESLLAGVPLQGAASWRNSDGAAASASLALDANGNSVHLDGQVGLTGTGAADAWDATIAAPALGRLAPLWRLLSASGNATATPADGLAGAIAGNAHISGRWPALTTQGQLEATALRVGAAGVQSAQARWRLGMAASAPMELDATLTGAALPNGASIEALRVQLNGTGAAHRIEARVESTARPPAWTGALQAALPAASGAAPAAPQALARSGAASADMRTRGAATRSTGVLQAEGGFIGAVVPSGVSGWRGRIGQLEIGSPTDAAAAWLRAGDIGLEVHWADGPLRVTVQPGHAAVFGAGVRWSRFAWQVAGDGPQTPMRLDVAAEFDPLPVAPLLRRAQPAFGWGGDLTIAGHIDIHSAPTVHADVVIERRGGDLSVTDETGTQALGLTDLRLGLAAADGVWSFTQAVAGKTLGVAAGAIVARTAPGATWPSATTPIQGVIELQVANLGTWGPWVPAGWRLGGELRTSASIGGTIGAPEYTGEIVGRSLSVRNFLQGVNVGDGDVAIALRGTSAHIERFSAQAGDGSINVEGNASLGRAPQARLKVSANKFQLLGRVDRRIVASGDAQLRLDGNTAALDGRFTLDEGLIDFSRGNAPSLADDVQVIRRQPGPLPAPGSGEAAALAQKTAANGNGNGAATTGGSAAPGRNLALDLKVDLGQHLRIRGHGLDSSLRGELRITSPAGRLAVNGTVYTVDGTYAAYGQKLTIDRGQLTFTGAIENPRLDIEATRPNLDIRVGVAVTGTALNPRVRLFSEPDLSEMDKLSWLVLGRASTGLGSADTALLQRAALALLSGEGGGPTDPFTKALGLDDVSVRQSEGEVRDTIVSLGKQLSRRWYVGYERGLNATTGSWQLIYRIAQRFTLRAQSGEDNSLDLIWTWRWQ